ncbi:MAG: hypothetical protein V1777_03160 [Candidatus Micrarchaeota archaeon]
MPKIRTAEQVQKAIDKRGFPSRSREESLLLHLFRWSEGNAKKDIVRRLDELNKTNRPKLSTNVIQRNRQKANLARWQEFFTINRDRIMQALNERNLDAVNAYLAKGLQIAKGRKALSDLAGLLDSFSDVCLKVRTRNSKAENYAKTALVQAIICAEKARDFFYADRLLHKAKINRIPLTTPWSRFFQNYFKGEFTKAARQNPEYVFDLLKDNRFDALLRKEQESLAYCWLCVADRLSADQPAVPEDRIENRKKVRYCWKSAFFAAKKSQNEKFAESIRRNAEKEGIEVKWTP